MRQNAAYFLPQHENESDANYRSRAETAKFTNIYRDLVENLAQRPFAKEVQLGEDTDEDFKEFANDVDGRGNNLHMFAGDLFFNAINFGVEWILVDYTDGVPENATRAVEKAMGARPLWVRYRADSVVAVETAIIEGHEQVTHIRFLETKKERVEFEEVEIQCVRVFDREPLPTPPGEMMQYGPPTWSLWELRKDKNGKEEWIRTKEPTPLAISEIPVIPVMTGPADWRHVDLLSSHGRRGGPANRPVPPRVCTEAHCHTDGLPDACSKRR